MKTIIQGSLAVAIVAVLFTASSASAQTRTSARVNATTTVRVATSTRSIRVQALQTNQADFKAAIESRKTEFRNSIKTLIAERKIMLKADAQVRVANRMTSIFNNLAARISRLQSADKKLAIRITEATNAGANMSTTSALYIDAQASLDKTRASLEAARGLAVTEVKSETSKEAMHALIKSVEDNVRATAAAYRKVLASLEAAYPSKSVRTGAEVNATSTIR